MLNWYANLFILATANTILVKLTTIMYLHKSVNREALRARNSFFWFNFIAWLVKLLYILDHIWGSIPWKTTQNSFKVIATLKWEPKLLSSRKLPSWCNFMRPFIWHKSRCVNQRVLRAWPKYLLKTGHKNVFLSLFLTFITPL